MSISTVFETLKAKLPPMPTRPPTHEPNRVAIIQLAILIGFATLLHFKIADVKVASFALLIFLLKVIIITRKLAPPPKLILIILTILSLGLIIYVYNGWNGQKAGISFLVLLGTLKFLESNNLRDYYISTLLLYFLAASAFLFDSSILSITIVILYTIGLTSILLQLTNPSTPSIKGSTSSSLIIIVKALPLAVLLFFFFPRVQGNFGFLPSQDSQNTSGLSDALVAGEMAASAFNNQLAFRVQFENGEIPPRSELYWRVKTMTTERNFLWEVVKPRNINSATHQTFQKNSDIQEGLWFYEILHEQSKDNFLPYLDYVRGYDKGKVTSDYSVLLTRQEQNSFSYRGSSSTVPSLNSDEKIDRIRFLQTESRPNAKVQALLEQWRSSNSSNQELANTVFKYLLDNPFKYSLAPPVLDEADPLGDFLLNTQSGYCEHYASAYTILMRWLRVPARVVVGYQGGTPVNNNQFLEVRYSDAHAWSEVWFNNRWNRIDPTSAISPDRIEFGMEALMELWGGDFFNDSDSAQALSNYLNPTGSALYLKKLRDSWKSAGYHWNKWVVNYDFDTQKELLTRLGLKHKNSVLMLVLIMIGGALVLMIFYFWQLIPKTIKRTELQRYYLSFTKKFNNVGLQKRASETPLEFSHRAIELAPHLKNNIEKITQDYYQLRYAKTTNEHEDKLNNFKKQIKQFKVKLNKT